MQNKEIGFISRKYESGNLGAGAIGNTEGDPGGKSYGIYQLSLNTGTLEDYLNDSGFGQYFQNLIPGSERFDDEWRHLAAIEEDQFAKDQHDFIFRTKYAPAESYATSLGFKINDAVSEAIWSIAVQHGKYKEIIADASDRCNDLNDPIDEIKSLYDARIDYVKHLHLSPQIERSLSIRYSREELDVLNLLKNESYSLPPAEQQCAQEPNLVQTIFDLFTNLFKK